VIQCLKKWTTWIMYIILKQQIDLWRWVNRLLRVTWIRRMLKQENFLILKVTYCAWEIIVSIEQEILFICARLMIALSKCLKSKRKMCLVVCNRLWQLIQNWCKIFLKRVKLSQTHLFQEVQFSLKIKDIRHTASMDSVLTEAN